MTSVKKLYGICYGPHRDGQDPTRNIHPNETEMNQDIVFLSKLTKRIRTYSPQNILNVIKSLDKNKIQINLGISLDVNNTNDIEISEAKNILAKYSDLIYCITVGNEVLARIIWDSNFDLDHVSPVIKKHIDKVKTNQMIPYVYDLKKAVSRSNNKNICVTTAEPSSNPLQLTFVTEISPSKSQPPGLTATQPVMVQPLSSVTITV